MGDLSAHFSASEFRCHGEGVRGHHPHPTPVSWQLVAKLEDLRHRLGDRPVRIVSGYRCAWWNGRVGGASHSRHLITDAADLPYGYARLSDAEAVGFHGIGTQDGWAVHVDTRPTKARWVY